MKLENFKVKTLLANIRGLNFFKHYAESVKIFESGIKIGYF